MGKIRVTVLGDEELEKKQKKEIKQKRQEKKLVKGAKGGERIVAVGPTEEELEKLEAAKVLEVSKEEKAATDETQKKKISQKKKTRARSNKYLASAKLIDKAKKYPLGEALKLLSKTRLADFDETVELHINTTETGISGTTTLPHGSGKEIKVAIASDQIIADVGNGKINFDVLLASPVMMPKLAKIARFLGPRGLMPNPKAGTITSDPEKAAKSYKAGQVNFKTEAKAPIMHLRVGKLSFGEKKLLENIQTVLDAVRKERIRSATLKSTMSPGIKLEI